MKTLYIIAKGMEKQSDEVIRELERQNKIPRVSLLEDALSAVVLDERYLSEKTPFIRKVLYRFLSVSSAQFIEALLIMHHYDIILSHTEKVSFPLALAMKWLRLTTPHIVVLSRITSVDPKRTKQKMWIFRKTRKKVSRYLIWSSVQRRIAIDQFGVPPHNIILLRRGIDQLFWRPEAVESDMICSVGMEARDYPTLVEALRGLELKCHIAAGASRGDMFKTVERLLNIDDLPENIQIGKKNSEELRALYARSRFTVVPLVPTDSDNGLTTILESMSMGKPVICSKTEGQIDIIQDGVTGIYVPQGDVKALREAILMLWNDPQRCARMGIAARKFIVETHNLEQFVQAVKVEVNRSIGLIDTNPQMVVTPMKHNAQPIHMEVDQHSSRPNTY